MKAHAKLIMCNGIMHNEGNTQREMVIVISRKQTGASGNSYVYKNVVLFTILLIRTFI